MSAAHSLDEQRTSLKERVSELEADLKDVSREVVRLRETLEEVRQCDALTCPHCRRAIADVLDAEVVV